MATGLRLAHLEHENKVLLRALQLCFRDFKEYVERDSRALFLVSIIGYRDKASEEIRLGLKGPCD